MKKRLSININFTNRFLYTFISVVIILIVGVSVYAFGTSTPSTFGHSVGELAPPTGCNANEILQWSGSVWACTDSVAWIKSGNNIYYTTGKVGIGTSTPTKTLEVLGNASVIGFVNATNNIVGNNLRNKVCETGKVVQGFDSNGNIICQTDSTGSSSPCSGTAPQCSYGATCTTSGWVCNSAGYGGFI
jgi:hypothetical protein